LELNLLLYMIADSVRACDWILRKKMFYRKPYMAPSLHVNDWVCMAPSLHEIDRVGQLLEYCVSYVYCI